jgi:hypothetical protein
MGIKLVAIVENSKGISMDEFKEGLLNDKYGKHAWDEWTDPDGRVIKSWEEFEYKGRRYFSWVLSPKETYFSLYETDELPEDNPLRVLLFKVLLSVERIAGGPVYIGNDLFCLRTPEEETEKFKFFLPYKLDSLWESWREVAEKFGVPDNLCFIY